MSSERCYWVYILASKIGGTLYIGVTNDLVRRVYEHKMKFLGGFTNKYGIGRLVYFEQYDDVEAAIAREKRLKKWQRAWKIRLIEELNPNWDDLYPQIFLHPALVGKGARPVRNLNACRCQTGGQSVKPGGVGDLPAEKGDALAAVLAHDQALLSVVHPQREALGAEVDELHAQKSRAEAGPVLQ
jgi:putative endonuclease